MISFAIPHAHRTQSFHTNERTSRLTSQARGTRSRVHPNTISPSAQSPTCLRNVCSQAPREDFLTILHPSLQMYLHHVGLLETSPLKDFQHPLPLTTILQGIPFIQDYFKKHNSQATFHPFFILRVHCHHQNRHPLVPPPYSELPVISTTCPFLARDIRRQIPLPAVQRIFFSTPNRMYYTTSPAAHRYTPPLFSRPCLLEGSGLKHVASLGLGHRTR